MKSMKTRKLFLFACFGMAMAVAMIFFVSLTETAFAEDFDFDRRFPNNDEFEEKIRKADEACLPDPFPLIKHNYAYRLADGLITECATENMTAGQAFKYTVLALAAATTGPVGIAAAGYTMGEVSSDGMKCILKAFISASSDLTVQQKELLKKAVDLGGVLKDWKDFAENAATVAEKIPELAKPEHILNLKSAVEAGAAAYERSGEARTFVETVSDAAGDVANMAGEMQSRAAQEVSDYMHGETNNRIAEADQAIRDCRFNETVATLESAYKAAQEECRVYGVDYRLAEVKFRSFIYRTRISLAENNALFDGRYEQNELQKLYPHKEKSFRSKRTLLDDFAKKFNEINDLQGTMFEKFYELGVARSDYETVFATAHAGIDAGGGEEVCKSVLESVASLSSNINKLSPGCRDKLFAGSKAQIDRPRGIFMRFNNTERIRSQRWWREVDRIREAHAACNTDSAEARASALKSDIENNPIYLIENEQCKKIDQDVLLPELAGLRSPADCDPEDSLRILPGGLFVSRDEAGQERVSKAVAGQELFIQTNLGVSRLSRSDVLFVNLEVLLPGGREVPLQRLTVPVSPEHEGDYRATAVLLLPEDVPPGTCRITGRIRWGGLGADAGEASFVIEESQANLGEMVVSPTMGGSPERKYAPGDPISATVEVGFGLFDSEVRVSGTWILTYPDGRTQNLTPSEASFPAEQTAGATGTLTTEIRTSGTTPLGAYRLEVVAGVGAREVAKRSTTFEIVRLFENPTILITDTDEGQNSVQSFRPGDPFFVFTDMIYNSADPNRVVHVSVEFTGPDPGIRALDIGGDQSPARGSFRTGAQREIPAQILEGTYTAVVTLDGGFDQILRLQESFRIVFPVQFEGIWTLDGSQPPQVKNRYSGNDPFEWLMRYRFSDTRPDDQYSSAVWSQFGDLPPVPMLSSDPMGPGTPFPGQATTSFTGVVPPNMPSATYKLAGVVWYNDVAYYSPVTTFKIGQEPTITITSPQPGFEVDQKVLVVTGACADRNLEQAHMLTNGEAIPIKLRDGAFSAKTVLRPGQNNIVVVAENDVGTSEAVVWGTAYIQAAALKVVLTWETQGPDIDLWVTDPQGVVTNYRAKSPAEGRQLDVDDMSGPGMETYTIEVPLRGSYDIAVHYYNDHGWQGSVPFHLQITTWETTLSENRSGRTGTLYTAAGSREEQGAVVHFTVGLQ